MIQINYLKSGEEWFDLRVESNIEAFLNFNECPNTITADGYELAIISNWKNIPITNNSSCLWCGDMAWFILVNLRYTMRALKND